MNNSNIEPGGASPKARFDDSDSFDSISSATAFLKMQFAASREGNFPVLPRDEMTNVLNPGSPAHTPAAPEPGSPVWPENASGSPVSDYSPAPVSGSPVIEPENDFFPDAPTFEVPANPLLPPGYSETLDYNAIQYMNGFYRTQIGRYVRVEQQINSNEIVTRYGFLIGVGINYILLQDATTGNVYAIDSYSIKLFYVYYNFEGPFGIINGTRRE